MFHTKKFRVYHYSRHLFPIFTKNKQKLQKFCGNKPVLPKLFTPEFAHDLPVISPSFPRDIAPIWDVVFSLHLPSPIQIGMIRAMTHDRATPQILTADDWCDYALLDSGNLQKFERFGPYCFIRPEPQALWAPRLDVRQWKADGTFMPSQAGRQEGRREAHQEDNDDGEGGGWRLRDGLPPDWEVSYQDLRFRARPTPFRHLGFFPEQACHWDWCGTAIQTAKGPEKPRILNLFAYSGIASLLAAKAGAEVTHVDASKKAITHAFENRDSAGMQTAPIRFITDDAMRFVEREFRRGRRYDGIILDPPKYGRGPKGEIWRIEQDLVPLLAACRALLSKTPLFMVLTIYAIRASSQAAHYALHEVMSADPATANGLVTSGELAIAEAQADPRVISQANFARWQPAP
jgi:23S rRNA (cytosine1962-C5)-methyltransferase